MSEIRDVAPGLWLWRLKHPDWSTDAEWDPLVASTSAESGGEMRCSIRSRRPTTSTTARAPSRRSRTARRRARRASGSGSTARPPTIAGHPPADHVCDVDAFVRRYGARAFGPSLLRRHDIPATGLEPIEPGSKLPGGLVALYDGRGRQRDPALAAGAARARVRGRAHRAAGGASRRRRGTRSECCPRCARSWSSRSSPIASHGEPLHDRAAYERALELPPWGG